MKAWRATSLCVAALFALAGQAALAADTEQGTRLYGLHCAGCHGARGKPVLPGAPDLSRPMALMRADLALLSAVKNGRGAMPGYAGVLKEREILDIVAHMRTFR